MSDWIDDEKANRDMGINRPLLQSDHWAVNARYPGCTLEYCCECDQPTGCAGKGEDSNYTDDEVLKIRKRYTGLRGQKADLAREYNVAPSTIWFIVNDRFWKHLIVDKSSVLS